MHFIYYMNRLTATKVESTYLDCLTSNTQRIIMSVAGLERMTTGSAVSAYPTPFFVQFTISKLITYRNTIIIIEYLYTVITTGGSSPARTLWVLYVLSPDILCCFFSLFSIFILSQCTLYCYATCQIKFYHTIPYRATQVDMHNCIYVR